MSRQTFEFMTRLDALLDRERNALLAADFTALPSLLEEKIHLISLVEQSQVSRSDLSAVKQKISHNQSLLDEAMAAIRISAQRLSEVRSMRHTVSTYTRMGEKKLLRSETEMTVEKKA